MYFISLRMVRNYIRKTNRQEWSVENMQQAIASVLRQEMGLRKASVQFNVPKTTLQRAVQKKKRDETYTIDKSRGKFQCVFSPEQELELVQYLQDMETRLFGLTMKDCRSMAFQLAEKNKLKHPFNIEKQMAGEDWMSQFLTRHVQLSVRKPEATSGARAMGFNRPVVRQFFKLLSEIIDKHKLTPERIYNCDETGITVNPKGHSKIIAARGKRQVGILTSAERGETVTAEICISAAGAYMPPMLVFPRKRMRQEFEFGLPPGAWTECHETGWINTELFARWFAKFVQFSNATKENVVLLILDGHSTHTKNLEVIDNARENGVVLLCLPPHASHRLQPLDVSFMKPLSLYYEQETRKWLRINPGKVITLWQVASLFGSAFLNAATMRTAVKGFEATGIWPVNMDVFTDVDFLPSAPTDIDIPEDTARVDLSLLPTNHSVVMPEVANPVLVSHTETVMNTSSTSISSFPTLSPQCVIAIPKVQANPKRKTNRKRGRTAILTASPYKEELELAIEIKKKKEDLKGQGKKKLKFISAEKKSTGKTKKIKNKNGKKSSVEYTSDSSEEDSDAECLYCNDLYSNSTEGWISCISCYKWAHNSCADVDNEDDEIQYRCKFCSHE